MHGEKLLKFTETRARAPRAPCIYFAPAIGTVQELMNVPVQLCKSGLYFDNLSQKGMLFKQKIAITF
jgi:hypothetical protein